MSIPIADSFEQQLVDDGQTYEIAFEGHLGDSPRHCEIFLRGCRVGEATWYTGEGLLDRFPDSDTNPIKGWDRLCDELERLYEYMVQGDKAAKLMPWFETSSGHFLHYNGQGVWLHGELSFQAAIVTGHPLDDEGAELEGTYHRTKP